MKRSLYELLKADPKAVERFRSYVDQRVAGECWPWMRSVNDQGYGKLSVCGVLSGAHRIAWVLANDRDVPRGKVVMHSCDNPGCCNPVHLSVGSYADNARDCALKGRIRSGDPVVRAKMSEAQRQRWSDPAVRAKMNEGQRKRWADPVLRAKMSEVHRQRLADPAQRAKMSEAQRQRFADPVERAKASEALRQRLADPAVRAKMSEAHRQRLADPAVRAKMSEAARKRRERERAEREWMLKFYGA